MTSKLIRLDDGTLIEVEAQANESQQISSSAADRVQETMDKVVPILQKVCKPLIEVWKEISEDVLIEQAEIELGIAFEGEGNVYITRFQSNANVLIKLALKPKNNSNG